LVKSTGYAFFCESLFILKANKINIQQVPIILPGRTSGNSRMSALAAMRSVKVILQLFYIRVFNHEKLMLKRFV
jgi:dolichol-phosphate mannosyltransferase